MVGESAGLNFNGGAPVALTDGAMNTNEGCLTISDSIGNHLFYTDGVNVWDRNHVQMPNGTGLLGHASSTQSALITSQPGSNNIFYIFTTPAPVSWNIGPGIILSLTASQKPAVPIRLL